MKHKNAILLIILLAVVTILPLVHRTAQADPSDTTYVWIASGDANTLKDYLTREGSYVIILENDIDTKITTDDNSYWCEIVGRKAIDLNGHSITIHNDNVRQSTLFRIHADATLIISANADEDPDDVKITYNGYINEDGDVKIRNLFEVYGTLINNGANLHAGRSKSSTRHGNTVYRMTLGRGVWVKSGGTFVMNYGRVYGRGAMWNEDHLLVVSLTAIKADSDATVLINGGTVYGKGHANCFQLDSNANVRVASGYFESSPLRWILQNGIEHQDRRTEDVGIESKHIAENSTAAYKHVDDDLSSTSKSVTVTMKTQYCNINAVDAEMYEQDGSKFYLFPQNASTIKVSDYPEYFPGNPVKPYFDTNIHEGVHRYEFTWVITENGNDVAQAVTHYDHLDLKKDVPGFAPVPGKVYTVRCVMAECVVDPEGEKALALYSFSDSINVAETYTFGDAVPLTKELFPDDVFRQYLIDHFDRENGTDGYLSRKELLNITDLDLLSKGISSLEGIQYLPFVTAIDAEGNSITSYDGSGSPYLMSLEFRGNPLASIDLTKNFNLRVLDLTECDGKNANLSLDLTNCPNLRKLDLASSDFIYVDISNCATLRNLVLQNEPTDYVESGVSVYRDDAGKRVSVSLNRPGFLYVARFDEEHFPDPVLRAEICNHIHSLQEGALLDVYYAKAVDTIVIEEEDITSLKGIEYFPNLTWLDVTDGKLTEVDLTCNKKLEKVYLHRNKLTSLDVSGLTALETLSVFGNKLTWLDVRGLTALKYLDCQDNRIRTLDVSQNPSLTTLYCSNNQLRLLDVSNNANLEYLSCNNNHLESLDVTDCPELLTLSCAENGLAELYLGNNTKLKKLTACDNMVDTIDIKGCDILNSLVTGTSAARQEYNCGSYNIMCDSWSGENQTALKVDMYTLLLTDPQLTYAVVSFESNGGSEIPQISTLSGFPIYSLGTTPNKPDSIFLGWYTDPDFATEFIFGNSGTIVNENITLYAKWKDDVLLITDQPEDKEVAVGENALFICTVYGVGTLNYQWQYKAPISEEWKNSGQSGNKTNTLCVVVTAGLNGYQFRCIVTDGKGRTVTSTAATLTANPKITTQPADITVTVGSTAEFSVTAIGKAPLSYQWQYRKDGNSTWAASGQNGAKTATLSVAATAGLNGYQFRCIVTDGNNRKTYSDIATLTVNPKISEQPSDKSLLVGSTAKFTVAATGKGTLTYQWQYRKNAKASWANSGQKGAKTDTLLVSATAGLHGYQFRCVVTDGNGQKSYTRAAMLTLKPRITTQPVDKDLLVGSTAKFTIAATGKGTLTYKWQYRKDENASWADSGQKGAKTDTLLVSTTAGLHSYQFRCVVTDGNGQKSYSKTVTLTLKPRITTQPADTNVTAGTKAKFTVVATGKSTLTYQWQFRKNSSSEWANSGQSGNKTATLSVAATKGMNGYQFRCLVTDGNGRKTYSSIVTLTVK